MSEIKVNSIKGVGASSAAITVNNSDGTCTANITNKPNRNLVINGAMQVAQRGTSSTSSGYNTVDRFQVQYNGADEAPTMAQVDVASGTTPYTSGFRKAYKITNGNQTGGAGTGDRLRYLYFFEAQDIANSGWNYTSASSFITISFWCKSSVAQNFFSRFNTIDGTAQSIPFQTGSLSADTWTKITKTISGNSNITVNNDTGNGLVFEFSLWNGTDYTSSGRALDTWAADDSGERFPDNTSTWYTTNDATFEITGMQLEVGSVATDFEHRSLTDELLRCQRYYISNSGGSDVYCFAAKGQGSSSCDVGIPLPVAMRASPTVTCSINRFFRSTTSSQSESTSNPSIAQYQSNVFSFVLAVNVGGHSSTNNEAGTWTPKTSGLILDAEL